MGTTVDGLGALREPDWGAAAPPQLWGPRPWVHGRTLLVSGLDSESETQLWFLLQALDLGGPVRLAVAGPSHGPWTVAEVLRKSILEVRRRGSRMCASGAAVESVVVAHSPPIHVAGSGGSWRRV